MWTAVYLIAAMVVLDGQPTWMPVQRHDLMRPFAYEQECREFAQFRYRRTPRILAYRCIWQADV